MHVQKSLSRLREEQQKSGEKQGPDISFELMATAYRRKRLMEGLMSGDREAQNQILTMATSQLKAEDGGAGDGGHMPGSSQRTKAKSLHTLLAEAGFGPSEGAVVKRMAAALPPAGLVEDTRDLENLTRFGFPRLRGLRRAHLDVLVQMVRPPPPPSLHHWFSSPTPNIKLRIRRTQLCGCGAILALYDWTARSRGERHARMFWNPLEREARRAVLQASALSWPACAVTRGCGETPAADTGGRHMHAHGRTPAGGLLAPRRFSTGGACMWNGHVAPAAVTAV